MITGQTLHDHGGSVKPGNRHSPTRLPPGCLTREAIAARVSRTLTSPTSNAIVRHIAGSADPHLTRAASAYWGSLFDHTAQVVRRAQRRGEASADFDPVAAIENLLAPLYLRLLITGQPLDRQLIDDLVARTSRLLAP